MLPSTGYFKALSCPFYDSGLCERPYCHFRHVKKETPCVSNEDIESGAILQQLVSEAVKKVLQQSEGSNVPQSSQDAVLEGSTTRSEVSHASSQQKVTYNPTPISELKRIITDDIENNEENNEQRKRHIPVPYTPRKPATVPIKRPDESNGECQPFIYTPPSVKYLPGSNESPKLDPYTPKGFTESTETYLPGVEKEIQEYKPVETQCSSKRNYIPSDTNVVKKKVLEYKPAKVSTKAASAVTYEPTPRSQVPCFSSEEDEPETKKRKLSPCLIGLDDLGPEFDLLGEILDEEKSKDNLPTFIDVLKIVKEPKKLGIKSISESKRSDSKEKNKKEKFLEVKDKEDKKSKTTSSDKKSSHKRSSKEKDRDKDRNKEREKFKEKHKEKGNDKDKDRYKKKEKELSCTKDNNKRSKSSEKSKRTEINSSKHSIKIKKDSGRSKEDKVYLSSSSSSSKNDSKMKDKSHQSNKTHKHSKEKHRSKENKEKSKVETIKNVVLNESYDDDHHFDDNFANDLDEEVSESDEENIALECKRIFEEYIPTEKPQTQEETTHQDGNIDSEYIPSKKRISHTLDKNIKVVPKLPIKPDYKVSAAQKMAERLAKVREYHASKAALENNHNKSEPAKTTPTSSVNSKIRIAHVPYASTLLSAKKTISIKPSSSKMEPPASTITQTVKKGSLRVAHIPNEKFIDRPGVLEPLASKIPANIRSTYLNMMIDECLKMYLTASDAYARAQHEELNTSKKCSTIPIYKNSAVLTVSRLRKEILECNGVKKSGSESTSGNNGKTGSVSPGSSWSILNRHNRDVDNSVELRGARLYYNIKKWVLTEEQLQENGFPRPHPSETRGRAIIHVQDKKQKPPKGFIRTCCRCQRDYTVDKRGLATTKEECIYHPNRKYRFRGNIKYQCCSQDGSADGCCVAPSHVYEYVDYDNLKGFVTTMPPEREMADYGVYALDCEMCYTTQGLDLTRITVINSSCKVVYETLIKPLHPIIDYNTRYSGITEEQMTDVKTTLLDVQATLLTMFNSKTILIGHSLESDCKALKLIHDTVIDTSVLFPHKMGPPYKRALRNLSSEYIRKIIQNSVDGHDSAEDATVCMELIIYKLKEDLKSR